MNKGFTLIEMMIVILLIGIMSAVAVPRFARRIELEELRAEKKFTYQIWEELELHAEEQFESTGTESWPENPLTVLGRTRNVIITFTLGIPDEDNEWQFDGFNIYHRRRNNEVWYFTYDRDTFYFSEQPVQL